MATETVGKAVIVTTAGGVAATGQYIVDVTSLPIPSIAAAIAVGGIAGLVHSLRLFDEDNAPVKLFIRDVCYGMFSGVMALFLVGLVHEVWPGFMEVGPWGAMFAAGIAGWMGKPGLDWISKRILERYK